MSFSFLTRPSVRFDINDALFYYKSINADLPKQFLKRISEAKVFIARSPFGFQIKHNNTRTLHLKQFPYHIHYLIDEENRHIIILAIIHSYRNPSDYSIR
jgi:mRNA-degrading endonuclease RelE of RelBE toxin-antitoxin system